MMILSENMSTKKKLIQKKYYLMVKQIDKAYMKEQVMIHQHWKSLKDWYDLS